MKQLSPIMSIVDMSASIGADGGVRVSGFHPDFLLPLIDAINNHVFDRVDEIPNFFGNYEIDYPVSL